ncbi:MAG: SMI1/KNR4 family protein [Acetatifactor sp.]|nr:SMI1/KNR4 family protein [Acetatifactor sp.]
MDKYSYLKKYHKDVEIIKDNIEEIPAIPQAWKDILHAPGTEEKISKVLVLWKRYAFPVLSNTISYLEDHLEDVELIRYRGKYSLLYSIKQPNGNVAYYEGGNPKERRLPDEVQKRWNDFPEKIRIFYENLHNGFFFYASSSMGIVAQEDILILGEEDWGILDELQEPLKISLDHSFGIFSSGMGGYVVVDLSDCNNDKAALWFASRQPRYDLNFWDLVDEWMVMGFQC